MDEINKLSLAELIDLLDQQTREYIKYSGTEAARKNMKHASFLSPALSVK